EGSEEQEGGVTSNNDSRWHARRYSPGVLTAQTTGSFPRSVDTFFRTNDTWLSDSQLVIFDALFDRANPWRVLRRELGHSGEPFPMLRDVHLREEHGYTHGLTDEELRHQLQWLCERGVLETASDYGETVYRITILGGELWSRERLPVWERY